MLYSWSCQPFIVNGAALAGGRGVAAEARAAGAIASRSARSVDVLGMVESGGLYHAAASVGRAIIPLLSEAEWVVTSWARTPRRRAPTAGTPPSNPSSSTRSTP